MTCLLAESYTNTSNSPQSSIKCKKKPEVNYLILKAFALEYTHEPKYDYFMHEHMPTGYGASYWKHWKMETQWKPNQNGGFLYNTFGNRMDIVQQQLSLHHLNDLLLHNSLLATGSNDWVFYSLIFILIFILPRDYIIFTKNQKTKHTSTWLVIMWTLSDVITISFCLNLHRTSTCVCTTCNLVVYPERSSWTVQIITIIIILLLLLLLSHWIYTSFIVCLNEFGFT